MTKWYPMETAPKDGTEIWAHTPDRGGYGFKTKWGNHCKDGWGPIDSCCGYYEDLKPTHWTHLPKPPKIEGDMSELPQVGKRYQHKTHGTVFVFDVQKRGRGYRVVYDRSGPDRDGYSHIQRLKDFQKATK